MNDLSKAAARAAATWLEVGEEAAAQRIDNFLLKRLKGVPKSHVYRVLRSGEVRVNSGRVKPEYRLQVGDRIRVPPMRVAAARPAPRPAEFPIAFEDPSLIVIDKPAGVAVHGGSGISFGVIESLRAARPQAKQLELAHRLDRDTSGLLMVAKKRSVLVALHRMLRDGEVEKVYTAVVAGEYRGPKEIRAALHKYVTGSGERRVAVHEEGMAAATNVKTLKARKDLSLVELRLLTGRTHQLRVHLAHVGHPILGDEKYGGEARKAAGRLMLHAGRLAFRHPASGEPVELDAPLPADMREFVRKAFP